MQRAAATASTAIIASLACIESHNPHCITFLCYMALNRTCFAGKKRSFWGAQTEQCNSRSHRSHRRGARRLLASCIIPSLTQLTQTRLPSRALWRGEFVYCTSSCRTADPTCRLRFCYALASVRRSYGR